MRVVVPLHGLILAISFLHAPAASAQRSVNPAHESNIELCRQVWWDRPEQQERCLIARRDLVEALQRNPYADPPEDASSTPCHGWMRGVIMEGHIPVRSIMKRCDKTRVEEAKALSFWFNYLRSAVTDAVMWQDEQQAADAQRYLARLDWCDSKYRTDDPTNYHDVLECADLSDPHSENPLWYSYGPSRVKVEDLDRRHVRRRTASPRHSTPSPAGANPIDGTPAQSGEPRVLCYL